MGDSRRDWRALMAVLAVSDLAAVLLAFGLAAALVWRPAIGINGGAPCESGKVPAAARTANVRTAAAPARSAVARGQHRVPLPQTTGPLHAAAGGASQMGVARVE